MDSGQIVAQVVEGKVHPVCALHVTNFLTHHCRPCPILNLGL